MFLRKQNIFINFINGLVIDHPTPSNISYLWNFGSLAGLLLLTQIISGIFLAMHYIPHVDFAFISVEHIVRDVNFGWFIKYLHANSASFFFIIVYIHIFRAVYYGLFSNPNEEVWYLGVTIYIVMMLTAFLGYVLPWGQMSLWGATVITNFFSVLPFIGFDAVSWLWGGYSVNYATLNRFFSLHFFLPFVLIVFVFMHLISLHAVGHGNPLGISLFTLGGDFIESVSFFPYFIIKDLVGIILMFIILVWVILFYPNLLSHPDNYIEANALATPAHIVPEWYFLPFYAILRSISNKFVGVIVMLLSIITLYFFPLMFRVAIISSTFRPLYKRCFWFFVVNACLLGWVGGNPVEFPFYEIGRCTTILYFMFIYSFFPCIASLETDSYAYETLHEN